MTTTTTTPKLTAEIVRHVQEAALLAQARAEPTLDTTRRLGGHTLDDLKLVLSRLAALADLDAVNAALLSDDDLAAVQAAVPALDRLTAALDATWPGLPEHGATLIATADVRPRHLRASHALSTAADALADAMTEGTRS